MRYRLAPRISPACTRLLMVEVFQTSAQVGETDGHGPPHR